MNQAILLVDGNGLMHRAYHATPPLKNNKYGQVNALYGFCSMLLQVVKKFSPESIMVAMDFPSKTFRDDLFLQYRSQRPPTDSALKSQFPLLKDLLKHAKINFYEVDGFEADDIIASFVHLPQFGKRQKMILSSDKDLYQLVSAETSIIKPTLKQGQGYEVFTPNEVKTNLGITPEQVIFYKAIAGDPSDNYKGIPGVGPKGAITIINDWENIPNLLSNWDKLGKSPNEIKLASSREIFELGVQLATLKTDIPLPKELLHFPASGEFLTNFTPVLAEFEFNSLLRRFNLQNTQAKSSLQPDLFSI